MITAYKKVEYTVIDIDKITPSEFSRIKSFYEDEYIKQLVLKNG